MSIAIAILGLALLILVHEAGHFFASLAVGLRPRKFYVGFPPAIVKTKRSGIEYGIGAIPLGGFVSIPGMHRPVPHDAERRFDAAVAEDPGLAGPVDRVKRSLVGDDLGASLATLDDLERELNARRALAGVDKSAEKGLTELRDGLGPDAYWKAATWKRLVAIGAGPGANILLAIVLFAVLFMTGSGKATRTIAEVVPDSPAAEVGLQPGDRLVAINDQTVDRVGHPGASSPARRAPPRPQSRTQRRRGRSRAGVGASYRRRVPPRIRARRGGPRPGRGGGTGVRDHRDHLQGDRALPRPPRDR